MSDAPADSPTAPAVVTATLASVPRRPSAVGMLLQVVLIAVGVFLGLAGEEWREDRENQRLARHVAALSHRGRSKP